MRIRLLGPMAVTGSDGEAVELKGERLRTLLVALALTPGRPVSLAALTETLWPDEPPANPANAVQALASRLRSALGRETVELTPAGYRLTLPPEQVDAVAFARAVQAGTHERALALWRGAPDLPGHPEEAARLLAVRQNAEDERTEAALTAGRGAEQVDALRAAVAAEPLRERPRAQLIRALQQAGRTAEALAVYEEGRTVLAEELGADPSPLLRAAHLAVLTEESPVPTRHALPAALTSFLGRERELAEVRAALTTSRLVTLIGPGGAGKTRLAVESARSHPTPLRLVELAPVAEGADLPGAVAAALQHRRELAPGAVLGGTAADTTDRLIDSIGTGRLLLVLDNCEHLIEAAAAFAARLLASCPGLRVLATSREPLGITGEQQLPVPPLGLPTPERPAGAAPEELRDYPAVRLFLDRAAAVRPGYAPGPEELETIVAVCRALDGQPLAIELAAARMRALDPEAIAARLSRRFRLLTGGSRDALPRHRTLRAVVDWSWDLLEQPERALLARLAVFSGPAGLDAVEAVGRVEPSLAGAGAAEPEPEPEPEEILDLLASLVDKSLVVRTDAGRYRLLETIRVYAAERLAEAGAVTATREAHARHYLALAERCEPQLYGHGQIAALAELNAAHENLIAALRWSVESGDAATAVRLVAGLGWYLWRRGEQGENLPLVQQALGLPPQDVDPTSRAVAYGITALYSLDTSWQPGPTLEMLHESIALRDALPDPEVHPLLALVDVMTALFELKDWRIVGLAEKLLDAGNPWVRATGRLFLGFALQNEGQAERAERMLREADESFREVGDLWGRSFVCSGLADFALWRGDVDGAVTLWEQAIAHEERMGVGADSPDYRARMISARYAAADSEQTIAELRQMVDAAQRAGSWSPLISSCTALANACRRAGRPEEGLPVLAQAEALLDQRLHGLPQILALLQSALGLAESACGHPERARAAHLRALRAGAASYDGPVIAAVLQGLADLSLREGDASRAALLLGSAHAFRGMADLSSWDLAQLSAAAREALGEEAYQGAYAEGRATPREELLASLGVRLGVREKS